MSLSKLCAQQLHGLSCTDVFHPGQTCWQVHAANVTRLVPSVAVFFVPLVFVPVFRNIGRVGWPEVRESLRQYCCMCVSAYLCSIASQMGWCGMYHLLGTFNAWSTIFVPTLLGNVPVFMLPERSAGYFANTIFAPIVESTMRRHWPLLCRSRPLQTILFMCMSAAILDTSARLRHDVFWFLQAQRSRTIAEPEAPPRSPVLDWLLPVERRVCQHKEGCDGFIYSGFKTYWNIGMILEIVRISFGSFALIKKNPGNIVEIFATKMKYRLIFFLVAYATSYRTLNCTLSRLQKTPGHGPNTAAAFLSGLAYLFYPNLTLLSHATAATVKLLWLRHDRNADGHTAPIVKFVNRLPVAQLVYMVCIAYAFHIRVFQPHTTAGFIYKTTQFTSGYRYDAIAAKIGQLLRTS